MKIKNVYLDMDGVLCDFEKQFIKLYGKEALSHRDRKEFSSNWSNFITDKNFEKLDWFPGAEELLVFIRKYDVNVEILTSSGGKKFHDGVAEQKRIWLKSHYIAYKPNVVSGRKFKKDWATPDSILIDDTSDVIEAFNKASGVGILHKDAGETIEKLKVLLA